MINTERVESLAIYSLAIFFSTEHEGNSHRTRLINRRNTYVVFACKVLDQLNWLNQLNQLNQESILPTAYFLLHTAPYLLFSTTALANASP